MENSGKRLIPREHQAEAIGAIAEALRDGSRATVILPCASGKTLIALRAAEPFAKVLILEPSLELIRQTLKAAGSDGLTGGRQVICVCSDQTVARVDRWEVDDKDLGIPVTTDYGILNEHLRDPAPAKLVFCTYQSQRLLQQAMPANFSFDLVIFDEGHNTAGRIDKAFGLALTDDGIRASQRLFLTATPRVFDLDADEPLRTVYSMDDPKVYGSTVFKMSNRQAVEKGIICDYQVIVSATTSREVQEAVRKGRSTLLPQSGASVEMAAAQLSIIKSMQATGARRAISFHATIEEAERFASDELGLFEKASIPVFHVRGAMSARQRVAVIEAFLAVEGPALLTNARCLTEGVDVPAIDLVALLARRESSLDLVQIVGRALRAHPGKTTGFVMLPVYVDSETTLESAVMSSDFGVMWEVLHSVLEEDIPLLDKRPPLRLGHPGNKQASHSKRASLRVVASDELLPELQRGIVIRPVSRFGKRWDEFLRLAKQYRSREGHLNVPPEHIENEVQLGRWCSRVRVLHKQNRLPAVVKETLDELGMEWDPAVVQWNRGIAALRQFAREHGHLVVPREAPYQSLSWFVRIAREKYRTGRLTEDQTRALDELYFPVDRYHAFRSHLLMDLSREISAAGSFAAFVAQPRRDSDPLHQYIQRARYLYRQGQLHRNEARHLEHLGVDLNRAPAGSTVRGLPKNAADEVRLNQIRELIERHGTFEAASKFLPVRLAGFLRGAIRKHADGSLPTSLSEELRELGVPLTQPDASWSDEERWHRATLRHLPRLEEAVRLHGGFAAAVRHLSAGVEEWVRDARRRRASGSLEGSLASKLTAVGVPLDTPIRAKNARRKPHSSVRLTFDQQFGVLKRFVAKHGRIPQRGERLFEDVDLVEFLRLQRRALRRGSLQPKRRELLDQLGIAWEDAPDGEATWLAHLAQLRAYREQHSHQRLPQTAEWRALRQWVNRQRKTKDRLSFARVQALKDANFSWDGATDRWEYAVAMLRAWRRQESADAPMPRALREVLRPYRDLHKKNALSSEMLSTLRLLNVGWALVDAKRSMMLARIARIQRAFGKPNAITIIRAQHQDIAAWLNQVSSGGIGGADLELRTALAKYGVDLSRFGQVEHFPTAVTNQERSG